MEKTTEPFKPMNGMIMISIPKSTGAIQLIGADVRENAVATVVAASPDVKHIRPGHTVKLKVTKSEYKVRDTAESEFIIIPAANVLYVENWTAEDEARYEV